MVLTGAGISAESGLKTFRDSGGLWEGHDVHKVATPEAWANNPELVLRFYNDRRKQALEAAPNPGHFALADLEKEFEVIIITQNVDTLHEKAGSSEVIHLHGELFKAQSTKDPHDVYEIHGWELNMGDCCEKGHQLRPHIVWFGEPVPLMEEAIEETFDADIFIVAGTSLIVYPAASLIDYVKHEVPKFVVDPKIPLIKDYNNLYLYEEPASTGLVKVRDILFKEHL